MFVLFSINRTFANTFVFYAPLLRLTISVGIRPFEPFVCLTASSESVQLAERVARNKSHLSELCLWKKC